MENSTWNGGGEDLLGSYRVSNSAMLDDADYIEKKSKVNSWSHSLHRSGKVDTELGEQVSFKYMTAPSILAGSVFAPKYPRSGIFGAFMNVSKAILGAGSFAMPKAFHDMGLWGGLITIAVVSVISPYTILNLVKCKTFVLKESFQRDITYVDTARYAFGSLGAGAVYFFSCMASVGVCAAFFAFIGDMLSSISADITSAVGLHGKSSVVDDMLSNGRICMAMSLFIVLPLVFLRSLSYLSFTSVLGMICLVSGMFATMYYGATEHGIKSLNNYDGFRLDTYFLSFGSVAFLFCVNFLILPIEKSMRQPKKFWISLDSSVIFVGVSNAAFGMFGYLFYGAATEGNVVQNVTNSVWTTIVKGSLAFDLVFTIPIVMAPTIEIVEKTFISPGGQWFEAKRNVIRVMLVLAALTCAQINSFNAITNMVGGVAMVSLGFVMPQAMCLKLFEQTWPTKILHWCLIVFGIMASIFTCVQTLIELFK